MRKHPFYEFVNMLTTHLKSELFQETVVKVGMKGFCAVKQEIESLIFELFGELPDCEYHRPVPASLYASLLHLSDYYVRRCAPQLLGSLEHVAGFIFPVGIGEELARRFDMFCC